MRTKLILLLCLIKCGLHAQLIHLEPASSHDSSYYDIRKMNDGSIWLGGEYGILKKINKGNVSSIPYPNNGSHILKIIENENVIYMACDKGTIYRLNKETGDAKVKVYKRFRKKCFYDMAIDKIGRAHV